MSRPRLILASTSPFRRELLARLRIPFAVMAPHFHEIPPAGRPLTADAVRALVLENARGKAESLRASCPDSWILASDQLAECDGLALAKPLAAERAFEQLRFLSEKEHWLHTAVVLLDARDGSTEAEVVTNRLRIRTLSDERIRRYVELEQPWNAAGSYLSERLGIALFDYLRGDDPTAIIGLPLIATCRLLEAAGLSPLDPVGPSPLEAAGMSSLESGGNPSLESEGMPPEARGLAGAPGPNEESRA